MKRLALLVLALSGCAMPTAESGKAAQGGSVTSGPPITVTVNIGTGGTVSTSSTSVPTAAPAASSTGGVKQEGNADGKVDLKVPAGAGGLSLSPPTPEAPKPEPKPGE